LVIILLMLIPFMLPSLIPWSRLALIRIFLAWDGALFLLEVWGSPGSSFVVYWGFFIQGFPFEPWIFTPSAFRDFPQHVYPQSGPTKEFKRRINGASIYSELNYAEGRLRDSCSQHFC
jgi:hypothetical protein